MCDHHIQVLATISTTTPIHVGGFGRSLAIAIRFAGLWAIRFAGLWAIRFTGLWAIRFAGLSAIRFAELSGIHYPGL